MKTTEERKDIAAAEARSTPSSARKPWKTPRVIFAEINRDTETSLGLGSDGSTIGFMSS
jgi:hypothetical protein